MMRPSPSRRSVQPSRREPRRGVTRRRCRCLRRPAAFVTPIATGRPAGVGRRRPIERGASSALAGLRRRARLTAPGGALRLRLRRPGGGIAPRTPLPLRRGMIGFLLGVRRPPLLLHLVVRPAHRRRPAARLPCVRRRVEWWRFRARFRQVQLVRRRRGRSGARLAGRVSLDSRARLSRGVHRLLAPVRDAVDDRQVREDLPEGPRVAEGSRSAESNHQQERSRGQRGAHAQRRTADAASFEPLPLRCSLPSDVSEQRAPRPPLRLG